MILGGDEPVKQMKNINNKQQILETKKDTSRMKRSPNDDTTQEGDTKDITTTGLQVYFQTCTNCSH